MKEKEIYLVRRIWTGKNKILRDELMGRIDPNCSLCKEFRKIKELENGSLVLYYTIGREKALQIAKKDWQEMEREFVLKQDAFQDEFLDNYPTFDTKDIKLAIKNTMIKRTLYEPKTL